MPLQLLGLVREKYRLHVGDAIRTGSRMPDPFGERDVDELERLMLVQ